MILWWFLQYTDMNQPRVYMYIFYLYIRNTTEGHTSAFLFPTLTFGGISHTACCVNSVPPPQCHPSAKLQNPEKLLLPVFGRSHT